MISNTGIRPSEAARIRHQDIRLVKDGDGTLYTIIVITSLNSKTGRERRIVARDCHKTFERYLIFKQETEYRFNISIKPTDFVFPSVSKNGFYTTPRTSNEYGAICRDKFKSMNLHIKSVVLKDSTAKIYFSFYSFRSYYMTQRLKEGLSIFTLSLQTGSSIATIQKYYSYNEMWSFRKEMVNHLRSNIKIEKPSNDLKLIAQDWK